MSKTFGRNRIASVILAAGESSRMGSPKPLLPCAGSTFIETVVKNHTSAGLDVYVVLGSSHQLISPLLDLRNLKVILNPDPSRGPLSSLQEALPEVWSYDALMLHPVDHPLVLASTIGALKATSSRVPACILIPTYAGGRGHPVLFPSRFFPDLRDAPLDSGARAVVRRNRASVQYLPVEDPGILVNIDTVEEYEKAFGFPDLMVCAPKER